MMRAWRNGRRACLRGKSERVWVRLPPPAPESKYKRETSCEEQLFLLNESNPHGFLGLPANCKICGVFFGFPENRQIFRMFIAPYLTSRKAAN